MQLFVFNTSKSIQFGAGQLNRLAELSAACGRQQNLRAMNIHEDFLPRLASDAMNQTRLLVNNPREVTEADALAIYRAAY